MLFSDGVFNWLFIVCVRCSGADLHCSKPLQRCHQENGKSRIHLLLHSSVSVRQDVLFPFPVCAREKLSWVKALFITLTSPSDSF